MPAIDTQEYQMVRITAKAHAMLKEICEQEKRGIGNQNEILIEAAYNAMFKSEHASQVMAAGIGRIPDLHTVGQ